MLMNDNALQDGNPAKQAVRSLTMAVDKGECFGLLGPNGAGKVCMTGTRFQAVSFAMPGLHCSRCKGCHPSVRMLAHSLILHSAFALGSAC